MLIFCILLSREITLGLSGIILACCDFSKFSYEFVVVKLY